MGEANSNGKTVGRAGLILTGGGARAAYQVGVLKALAEIHPSPAWPFPIIVGTSAGAVSASILAANVTRWHQSIVEIENVWANFHVAQVFRSDAAAMLKAGGRWMGSLFTGGMMGPPKSLLDNSPLRELLSKVTDFDAVRANVANGHLRALALCATSYFTARSVSFFEAETTISEWSRAQRHGERVPLSLDYLMASLGIPFLFPPICLSGEFFGDGAMRQTAPLSPGDSSRRRSPAGARCAAHAPRSDSAFRGVRFAADTRTTVRLHAGHALQRSDLRRPRKPGPHQPAVGACRWLHRHAADPTMLIAPSVDPSQLAAAT